MLKLAFLIEEFPEDPPLNVALDEAFGEGVGVDSTFTIIRFWRNSRTLVLGRFDPEILNFTRFRKAHGLNLKVTKRITGGTVVPLDEGCINISLISSRTKSLNFDEIYKQFWLGAIKGLKIFGINCTLGKAKYSFCDGSYNLLVNGKKLGGAAIARRKNFLLIQGTILNKCDTKWVADICNVFYQAVGKDSVVKENSLTTLSRELGKPRTFEEIIQVLQEGYKSCLDRKRCSRKLHLSSKKLEKALNKAKRLRGKYSIEVR